MINPYEPSNTARIRRTSRRADCYVDIATSPKQPCWSLLGSTIVPSEQSQLESYGVVLATPLEPQLQSLLEIAHEREFSMYVKLDSADDDPLFLNLLVDVDREEVGELDVLLYRESER